MMDLINKTISGVIEIGRGMFTIIKHTFRSPITLEYPEQKPELNARYHGRLALMVNSDGSNPCIACGTCARVCPCGDLIQISSHKDENNKLKLDNFTIDIGRCIFCGNCTEVCPKNALVMTDKFELADFSREACVYNKERLQLSIEESESLREKLEKVN